MRERAQELNDKLKGSVYDKYQVLDIIGSGTFGKVYLVKDIDNGQFYAMKHVLQNKKYKNRELEILSSIQSDYVVKLYRHFHMEEKEEVYLNLIMEYIPDTLSRLLRTNYPYKKFLQNDKVILYSKCLFTSLRDLHEAGITHRDIKPSNILISENHAKLCDFGSAKVLSADQKNISYICSRYYRAPQLLFGACFYSSQIDIWSVGCVIAEMITNHSLFDGSDSTAMLMKIVKMIGRPTAEDIKGMELQGLDINIVEVQRSGIGKNIKKYNPNVSDELIDLIQRTLVYNPERRITARQALDLPIFK